MSVRNYPTTSRVYFDMDGVLADYDLKALEMQLDPRKLKSIRGIYRELEVLDGAKEAVAEVLSLGYQVFALSKPPTENPHSATEKLIWISLNFPELGDHVILTPDKGCIGNERDFLIDDHPEWANASNFKGTLMHFKGAWDPILQVIRNARSLHKL